MELILLWLEEREMEQLEEELKHWAETELPKLSEKFDKEKEEILKKFGFPKRQGNEFAKEEKFELLLLNCFS